MMILAIVATLAAQAAPPARIVYDVPGMREARVERNVVYSSPDGRQLRADIYTPAAGDGPWPIVLFISGAAQNPKDWPLYISWGQLAAASGLAGVTLEHRLGFPERRYSEGAADISALVGYLKANGARHRVDAQRICLIVYSGGGPMWTVGLRDRDPSIRCLAGFYPFLSTEHLNLTEAKTTKEVAAAHSPIAFLDRPGLVPMLVARAGRDQIPGVNASIDAFVAEALRRNAPIEVINHPEGRHGFDYLDDGPRTRAIIERVVSFLKTHLPAR